MLKKLKKSNNQHIKLKEQKKTMNNVSFCVYQLSLYHLGCFILKIIWLYLFYLIFIFEFNDVIN
jgi:hypothetical protein